MEGKLHDEQANFNDKNFAEAGGYLKEIPWRDIEYLPVSGSHTAAAINIAEGGVPGLHAELCNEEGHVDKNKVLQLCPSLEKTMAEGIPSIVFRRELEVAFPELPEFLSEAGNRCSLTYIVPAPELAQTGKKRRVAATRKRQSAADLRVA